MKTLTALLLGLTVGFFLGRSGNPAPASPTLAGSRGPASVPMEATPEAAPPAAVITPAPMANPSPRPAWRARISADPIAPQVEEKIRAANLFP